MKHGKRKGKRGQRKKGASASSAETASSSGAAESPQATKGPASRAGIEPWWEREPERLEYELYQLTAAGIMFQVDETLKATGLLVIDVEINTEFEAGLSLKIRFPDLYPYFRFEVEAPTLALPHHQNPFGRQLCLIGRGTVNWNTDDTLAGFLTQRLPSVLSSGASEAPDEVSGLEEPQAEPFSDYYRYGKEAMILVDSSWSIEGQVTRGSLTLGLAESPIESVRGAVLSISAEDGRILAEAAPQIRALYKRQIEARWVRVDAPVVECDANRFLEILRAQQEFLGKPALRLVPGGRLDIVGVLFPEEHIWRGEPSTGWVFAVEASKQLGRTTLSGAYLVRAGRSGRADMTGRVPELVGLQEKKVAIVGCGALGGPSAIEFARAGLGELRLLDCDFVDPPMTVRWPLGLNVSGKSKVESLTRFIRESYPHTKVQPFEHRVGSIRENATEQSDLEVLRELIEGVDLIYDATAEIGINHLLSDLAAEYQVPYLCISATHGAWGGRLIRVRPHGRTNGCWMCHQWALDETTIPSSPADQSKLVQPAGCAAPTFTGSGFDLGSIALAGVRLAIGTLQSDVVSGYPNVDWDIAVIGFRDSTGASIPPQWKVFSLERHQSCENHKADAK